MSLFDKLLMFTNDNKAKKSLPGAKAFLYCSQKSDKGETPQCICQRASLTVEAAIILPVFVCFFAFLLFYFRIMQIQLTVQNALEETGRNLAILSVEELESPREGTGYLALAKGMLYLKLKDDKLVEEYISGGAVGVSLLASEFDGDYILLNANYVMRFPVKLLGNQDFLICHKTRFRKWTGWHGVLKNENSDEWVYITEHGEVYHMRRSCPYLDLSIQSISRDELRVKRNDSGEIYEECERCEKEKAQSAVYITDYGDKYHLVIDCAGLKRTIYQMKLSEVGGLPACSKCTK